ncbi:GNAT family N-acetyltransferase [uncultured Bifidobacterium sp.]|uniref:GNAT family N-acetyltransferase n=1 Tax=uncultured Bifidobacterium sp. TaxID=165187 RepID=UPI0026158C0F|nr:GNAT family N-acetyltransferase [uncultured Bifidobacterium sp.]
MGIRLFRLGGDSAGYADAAWDYLQACKAAGDDELAGLGCLQGCLSLDQVRRDWLPRVINEAKGEHLPQGYVPALQFLALEPDDTLVGMIQLRLALNDYLLERGGNIGYSVRPDRRRRGYASRMLMDCLDKARQEGMTRVLLTCAQENGGSRRTILANGGKLEDTRYMADGVGIQRYWIEL